MPQAQTVTLPGGLQTSVLEAGRRDDRRASVLLLHGWMASAGINWYRALHYLGRYFHVLAPDIRGHGCLGAGAPRFTVEAVADDQAQLVDALGLGPVVVVGYSMGGAIAQILARRHPTVLKGMVLCATAPAFAEYTWLRPAVRLAGRAGGDLARAWPAAAQAVLRRRLRAHRTKGEGVVEGLSDRAYDQRAQASLACFIEAGAVLNAFDSRAWLHELSVPTSVVITTADRRVAPWRQDSLAALIPGARRLTVDAGHDAVVSNAELFLPVLHRACTIAGGLPVALA